MICSTPALRSTAVEQTLTRRLRTQRVSDCLQEIRYSQHGAGRQRQFHASLSVDCSSHRFLRRDLKAVTDCCRCRYRKVIVIAEVNSKRWAATLTGGVFSSLSRNKTEYPGYRLSQPYAQENREDKKVGHSSQQQYRLVWTALQTLREEVRNLQLSELERDESLRGRQTVDDREAIQQSFVGLDQALDDIEATLATIGEATGEIGKL
ncbi:hypothetical protein ALQ64_04561 [Pseudomonas cannabina]|uniref:Uncharacterized protein n=1 Tax=Pseudomonas cannabina TaxID=86840 RepID=A0A3M3KYD0_PSECA|nr:hypothetical protein ALQ64_04561 [Pseudomonas cannabina]